MLVRDITERKLAEEALQRRNRELRRLTARLAEAQELERQNLARELHDQIGQGLTAISLNLTIIDQSLDEEASPLVRSRLDDSLRLLEETTRQVRTVMAELRPPMLDDYGLLPTLRWQLEQFSARTGIDSRLEGDEPTLQLPRNVELTQYRISQEALSNVAKHSGASEVTVVLRTSQQESQLIVEDNGCGFNSHDQMNASSVGHWGLLTMQERAQSVGGVVNVFSVPGQGAPSCLACRWSQVLQRQAGNKFDKLLHPDMIQGEFTTSRLSQSQSRCMPATRWSHFYCGDHAFQEDKVIKVYLVDDHAVVREGLRYLLEAQDDIAVVGDSGNGRQAVTEVKQLAPDVVVMDVSMPEMSGIEATMQIIEALPKTHVVILSMQGSVEHVYRGLQAGAHGYLLKESAGKVLVEAVRSVHSGGRYLSTGITETLVDDYLHQRTTAAETSPLERLSRREREVLQLVVEGRSSVEIGELLSLSPKTVDTYRSRLMQKLGISDVPTLVKFAIQHGLTSL